MNLINKLLLSIDFSQVYYDNNPPKDPYDDLFRCLIFIGIIVFIGVFIFFMIKIAKSIHFSIKNTSKNTTPAETAAQEATKETVAINYCPNCGQKLGENQNFCPNCGKNVKK